MYWIVLLISMLILFPNLGAIELLDPDEPVYAETAKEMIRFHDYLSPRIYGDYWYDKPPLYYWLVAGAFRVFGVSEFAARLPATVSALLCVILVAYYASKKINPRVGIFSGLILVTSFEFFYLAKAAVTDSTLNLLLTACLLAMFEKRYIIGGVLAGLAIVTKGPIGLFFPAVILGIYLLVTKQIAELKRREIWLGLLACGVVSVPWYAAMYGVHGMEFINTFLGFHNITRFASPEHPETAVWYFYIPVLLIGFFPWSLFLFGAIGNLLKKLYQQRAIDQVQCFFLIWAAIVFIFFSISKTKLVSYILPVFPPVSLLTGWYLDKIGCLGDYTKFKWLRVCQALFILLLSGGLFYASISLPEIQTGSLMAALVLLAMAVGGFWLSGRFGTVGLVSVQVVGMLLFANIFIYSMVPQVEGRLGCKAFAQHLQAEYDETVPLYIAKFLRPGIAYYADIYGKEMVNDEGWKKELAREGMAYYVVTQSMYQQLSDLERKSLLVVISEDDKLLLKKVIVDQPTKRVE